MWRARRGGPRTPPETADANLDCAFVENALFTPFLDCEKSIRIELVTRPDQVTNDGINLTPVRAGPDGAGGGVDGVAAAAATALLSSAGNGGTVTELEPAPPLASFRYGH